MKWTTKRSWWAAAVVSARVVLVAVEVAAAVDVDVTGVHGGGGLFEGGNQHLDDQLTPVCGLPTMPLAVWPGLTRTWRSGNGEGDGRGMLVLVLVLKTDRQ